MTLELPRAALQRLRAHARDAYPEECCGFLVGREGARREVVEVRRASNVHPDPRNVRYAVDPQEHLKLEIELRETDRQILGFYHSHPDHPGVPSAWDMERSWPGYSYVIVEVRRGEPQDVRSFRMDRDRGLLEEEPIVQPSARHRAPPRAIPKPAGARPKTRAIASHARTSRRR